jgi:regulatory protein
LAEGPSLRARAFAMLARRDHGRVELGRKLARHADESDDIPALLDDLERSGYLSDGRVAEQIARRHAGRHGPLRIARDLEARGVRATDIETVVSAAREAEPAQALLVLRRKFPDPPEDAAGYARQGRYLANRGFSPEVIRRVLRARPEPDG